MKESFNTIRIILNNTKKTVLKEIAYTILNKDDNFTFLDKRQQWYLYILDIIDTKFLNQQMTRMIKPNQEMSV